MIRQKHKQNPIVEKIVTFLCSVAFAFFLGLPMAQAFHFPWDQGHDTTDWEDPDDPGPCEGPDCDPCNSTGSPVYVPNGHFIWTETDIFLYGIPELGLTRTYNSNDLRSGHFGNGWTTGCDVSLLITTASEPKGDGSGFHAVTRYIVRFPDGKRYEYTQLDGEPLEAPSGRFEKIELQNNGNVRLLYPNGRSQEFDPSGRLVFDSDANGNGLIYSYNTGSQLTRIADIHGRFMDFTYNSSGYTASVTDHGGRVWQYAYDAKGNLIAVTNPLGGVRQYEYAAYQPSGDSQIYYQLTKITDEVGVVESAITY